MIEDDDTVPPVDDTEFIELPSYHPPDDSEIQMEIPIPSTYKQKKTTVADLKQEAASLGASVKGSKAELQKR